MAGDRRPQRSRFANPGALGYASVVRIALCFAALLGACQCQSKTTAMSGSGSGSAAASGSGSGSGSAPAERTTLDIELPKLSGRPPKQTTAPLTKDDFRRLGEITFDEFKREVTNYPDTVAIRQRATLRPRMSVNISIGDCTEKHKCLPMKLDAWKADEAELKKALVDPDLVGRPDTVFDIEQTDLAGQPMIGIYIAGQFFGRDEVGNPKGSYSLAYQLNYNDGFNLVRLTVTFADDPRDSLAAMEAALPRPFMERVAKAFLDAYTQAWQ